IRTEATGSRSSTPATAIRNRLSTNADPGVSTATTAWPSGWSSTAARRTTAPTSTADRLGPLVCREPTPLSRSEVAAPRFRDLRSQHRGGIAESIDLPRRGDHKRSPQMTQPRPQQVRHAQPGSDTTQLDQASNQQALDTLPMTRQAPSLRPSRRDNGGAPRPLCPSEHQAPQPPTQRWSAETTVRAQWSRRSVVVSSWQLRNSGCMAGLSPSPDTPVLVPRIV